MKKAFVTPVLVPGMHLTTLTLGECTTATPCGN